MKREALKHPKMHDLAGRLGVPLAHAIGIVEMLWDWCADVTPQGNIGRWPDTSIAGGCGWHGDATLLVESLIGAGWLDRCATHRLVVHDLADHAPQWWKQKLSKLGKPFLAAVTTVERTVEATEPTAVATVEGTEHAKVPSTVPSILETSAPPTSAPPTSGDSSEPASPPADPPPRQRRSYQQNFEAFWRAYPRHVGKEAAEKAYNRAVGRLHRPDAHEFLLEAATAFAGSDKGRSGEFCPHASTWLNEGRYDDDRAEWARAGPANEPIRGIDLGWINDGSGGESL